MCGKQTKKKISLYSTFAITRRRKQSQGRQLTHFFKQHSGILRQKKVLLKIHLKIQNLSIIWRGQSSTSAYPSNYCGLQGLRPLDTKTGLHDSNVKNIFKKKQTCTIT